MVNRIMRAAGDLEKALNSKDPDKVNRARKDLKAAEDKASKEEHQEAIRAYGNRKG